MDNPNYHKRKSLCVRAEWDSKPVSINEVFNAISKGDASKILRWIREGLDLDSVGRDECGFQRTLLIHAIHKEKIAIARILIKAGADVNQEVTYWEEYPHSLVTNYPLGEAINFNLPTTVKDLLEAGAQFFDGCDGYGGKEALFRRIICDDAAKTLEVLLDYHIDIRDDHISLDIALVNFHAIAPDIARLLFSKGFSFNTKTAAICSRNMQGDREKITSMEDICWLASMGISLSDKAVAGPWRLSDISIYPPECIIEKYLRKINELRAILSDTDWPTVISEIVVEFYIHEENLKKLKLKSFFQQYVFKY